MEHGAVHLHSRLWLLPVWQHCIAHLLLLFTLQDVSFTLRVAAALWNQYAGTCSKCGTVKPSEFNIHLNSDCNSLFPVSIHGIHSLYLYLWLSLCCCGGDRRDLLCGYEILVSGSVIIWRGYVYILINVSVMFLTLFVDLENRDVCNYGSKLRLSLVHILTNKARTRIAHQFILRTFILQ
jgi:hypothetical protein